MTSRRNLISRARLNENPVASPSPRRRQPENQDPTPLPPYEPPICQLSASGRRALDQLRINYDYSKYQKHIDESKKLIPIVIGDANDRLHLRREKVAKAAERRRRQEKGDDEKTEQEVEEETVAAGLGRKVERETERAEKAMRDLIDYSDELAMQEHIWQDVTTTIAAEPPSRPPPERQPREGRPRNDDSDEDEGDEEEEEIDPEAEVDITSATELLQKARDDYIATYTSKTMLERYENNAYKGFKSAVHDALHPGDNAPPLPKASKWFPQDPADSPSHANDPNEEEDEQSEEEIYILGGKTDYKCPLTLQVLKEPYTNNKCKHTFEKERIIEYINEQGATFTQSQATGPRKSQKQIKCIQVGCENMLKVVDFYDDSEILRKMRRSNRQAAYEMEDDDEEDEAPRGTQRNRPEELDEESGEDVQQRRNFARIKRERQSRSFDVAPPSDSYDMGED